MHRYAIAVGLVLVVPLDGAAAVLPCGQLQHVRTIQPKASIDAVAVYDDNGVPQVAHIEDSGIFLDGLEVVRRDRNKTFQPWIDLSKNHVCYAYSDQRSPGWRIECLKKGAAAPVVMVNEKIKVGVEGFASIDDENLGWLSTAHSNISFKRLSDGAVIGNSTVLAEGDLILGGGDAVVFFSNHVYLEPVPTGIPYKVPPVYKTYRFGLDPNGRYLAYDQYLSGGSLPGISSERVVFLFDYADKQYRGVENLKPADAYRLNMSPVEERAFVTALVLGSASAGHQAYVRVYSVPPPSGQPGEIFVQGTSYSVVEASERSPNGTPRFSKFQFDAYGRFVAFGFVDDQNVKSIYVCEYQWDWR